LVAKGPLPEPGSCSIKIGPFLEIEARRGPGDTAGMSRLAVIPKVPC
jgi:hypothetical protein